MKNPSMKNPSMKVSPYEKYILMTKQRWKYYDFPRAISFTREFTCMGVCTCACNFTCLREQYAKHKHKKTKHKKTYKLSNIHNKKKYKESKIVKKCIGWINLLVVSRGKCNNGIKRENSTGSLSIINRTYLI